jgi:hypothetical protein
MPYEDLNNIRYNVERFLAQSLGVQDTLDYANKRPEELGIRGSSGGRADRARHLLLSSRLHREHPNTAHIGLELHEHQGDLEQVRQSLSGHDEDAARTRAETAQDRLHNKMGKTLSSFSQDETETLVKNLPDPMEAISLPTNTRSIPPAYAVPPTSNINDLDFDNVRRKKEPGSMQNLLQKSLHILSMADPHGVKQRLEEQFASGPWAEASSRMTVAQAAPPAPAPTQETPVADAAFKKSFGTLKRPTLGG